MTQQMQAAIVMLSISLIVVLPLITGVQRSKKKKLNEERLDYWKIKLAEAEAQYEEFKRYSESVLSQQQTPIKKTRKASSTKKKK